MGLADRVRRAITDDRLVDIGRYAQDAQSLKGPVGERVFERLRQRGHAARSVVVDKEDLVIGGTENLRDRIERQRDTTVGVIAMLVVATINDHGDHGREPQSRACI